MDLYVKPTDLKRVVIIGAGFGGIETAKYLRNKNLQVVILDKHNYHNFQPLLYQVATGGLEPDSIVYPIRKIFRNVDNVRVRMTKVLAIQPELKNINTSDGNIQYDYLVLATGATNNFFNFEPLKGQLLRLKSVPDALNLRSFIMQNFEKATATTDADVRTKLMNIAIVGGGPTGVELAGALGEMKKFIFPKDYPDLDVRQMRVMVFESSSRLLGSMSKEASAKAFEFLKKFGVELYLNTMAADYKDGILYTQNGRSYPAETVIWTAGVKGIFPEGLDQATIVGGNRIKVDAYNRIEGLEHIFAIGDVAAMISDETPKGHPLLAPVAMQQGRLLAKNILRMEQGKPLVAFRYKDQGSMATVGRNKAVVDLPHVRFQGAFAWFVWMFLHIFSIIGFRNKLVALWGWVYNYLTYDRALRLIIRPFKKSGQISSSLVEEELRK